jgi:hypothetical protein
VGLDRIEKSWEVVFEVLEIIPVFGAVRSLVGQGLRIAVAVCITEIAQPLGNGRFINSGITRSGGVTRVLFVHQLGS